jgi:hypothetical protein
MIHCKKISWDTWEIRMQCGKTFYGRTKTMVLKQLEEWTSERTN